MKTLMKTLIPAAFLFLFADLGGPREAEAGETYPPPAGCNNNDVKGGMRCWGTMRGFRLSPDPGAYAIIHTDYATTGRVSSRSFGAKFNGVEYGCTIIPWVFPDEAVNQILGNADVYFVITARPDGACALEAISMQSYYVP